MVLNLTCLFQARRPWTQQLMFLPPVEATIRYWYGYEVSVRAETQCKPAANKVCQRPLPSSYYCRIKAFDDSVYTKTPSKVYELSTP